MKKISRRNFLKTCAIAGSAAALTACGGSSSTTSGSAGNTSGSASSGPQTITFYPRDANVSSGLVGGFKGEYFASRGFNLDIWAYSDEKTNAILASGDLPDVMFIPEQSLDIMVQGGMLLNLDDYLDQMPHVNSSEKIEKSLNFARKFKSAGTGGLYGTPCFGTILNNGSDSSFWACMVLWYRWQGYFEHQLPYLLEADMYNGEYHSILDKDSLYYKGLKWYNKVYRRGLMDPDSINNDRPTQKVKVDGGYAQIPSGYLPGWAPTYLEYHIPGTKVFYAPVTTYGDSRYLIGINANTKNVEACLAYLDMLADPEAYLNIIQGPDGEFWYSDDQGNAYLTEAGTKWFEDGHNDSSGFTLSNGETLEMWNSPFLARNGTLTRFGDGKGGYRTASILGWTEFSEIGTSSKVFDQWRATTGHENWKEWLGDDYSGESPLQDVFSFTSLPDDNMQLMIDAIKDKVTTASWKMVYSSSDSEFDTLWDQMVADCNGLDANSIMEWRLADLENAKQIRDSL